MHALEMKSVTYVSGALSRWPYFLSVHSVVTELFRQHLFIGLFVFY